MQVATVIRARVANRQVRVGTLNEGAAELRPAGVERSHARPMEQTSPLIVIAAGGGVSPLVGDLGLCLVVAAVLAIAFVKLEIPAIAALLGASYQEALTEEHSMRGGR